MVALRAHEPSPRTRGYTPERFTNQLSAQISCGNHLNVPTHDDLWACLHPVALALSFERLRGDLLNRLTALNGSELEMSAQRRRDADAEHHELTAARKRRR